MQDGCAKAVTTEMAARVMCIVEWFVVVRCRRSGKDRLDGRVHGCLCGSGDRLGRMCRFGVVAQLEVSEIGTWKAPALRVWVVSVKSCFVRSRK